MDRESIKLKLNRIFQATFDNPSLHVSEDMTAADVEGWDSLTHTDLIVAVEKDFGIKLTTKEVRSLKTVGGLITILENKTA